MSFMTRSLLILLAAAAAIAPTRAGETERKWTSSMWAVSSAPPERFHISSVTGEGERLYGEFYYSNFVDDKVPPTATFGASQLPDGTIWPHVRLYVGNDRKGPWQELDAPRKEGKP